MHVELAGFGRSSVVFCNKHINQGSQKQLDMSSAATLNTFKQQLKTELFIRSCNLLCLLMHAHILFNSVLLLHNSFFFLCEVS